MGQKIEIPSVVPVDNVALFETDRSITGQDGAGFDESPEQADTPPAELAQRMFEALSELERVYVASNQVTAKRSADWDAESLGAAKDIITNLFVFYTAV